jgi:hypothetical protein
MWSRSGSPDWRAFPAQIGAVLSVALVALQQTRGPFVASRESGIEHRRRRCRHDRAVGNHSESYQVNSNKGTEMRTAVYKGICLDIPFEIDGNYVFVVPSLEKNYPSYQVMCEALEKHHKDTEATEREKLSLDAIDDDGVKRTLIGVHAGHGRLLYKPKSDDDKHLYPNVGWVPEAIAREAALEDELAKVRDVLKMVELTAKEHSYDRFEQSMHAAAVKKVKAQYEAVKTIVAKCTFAEAVAKSTAKNCQDASLLPLRTQP